jgi:hypothetical protein
MHGMDSNNKGRGFHEGGGHFGANYRSKDENFKAAHVHYSIILGLHGVTHTHKEVRDWMDSTHGRHLSDHEKSQKGRATVAHVIHSFGSFKKTYKPELHEEVKAPMMITEQTKKLVRKSYLGVVRGTTKTGQKANPINLNPTIDIKRKKKI